MLVFADYYKQVMNKAVYHCPKHYFFILIFLNLILSIKEWPRKCRIYTVKLIMFQVTANRFVYFQSFCFFNSGVIVKANGVPYHVSCFKCESCGMNLKQKGRTEGVGKSKRLSVCACMQANE